jgi:probable F420-dependent oxidoreductase
VTAGNFTRERSGVSRATRADSRTTDRQNGGVVEFWQAVAFLEPDQLLTVAKAADEYGFHSITVSDHIFYPEPLQSPYPYTPDGKPFWSAETPFPDPWVMIGAMAAVTTRLRFATNIYIAPARDLFTVAKLVATASVIAGGRVSLGAGAGWCKDEFDQTGQDFATRGARLEEMVAALRTLWAGGTVEHHGRHYDFGPLQMSPAPEAPVPIYLGGDSPAAMRRAAKVADGWIGNAYSTEDAEDRLRRIDAELAAAGRSEVPFKKVLSLYDPPSPDLYRRFEELGVTGLICAPWMVADVTRGNFNSPAETKLAAMERFAEDIIQRMDEA